MNTKYTFDSYHLGKAFVAELLEMGYKDSTVIVSRPDDVFVIVDEEPKVVRRVRPNSSYANQCKQKFHLDELWAQAIQHAKKQIDHEFQIGDWVTNSTGVLIRIQQETKNGYKGYGFPLGGEWTDGTHWDTLKYTDLRKATQKELEEAFIKEAERRGLKHGTFVCLKGREEHDPEPLDDGVYDFDISKDIFYIHNNIAYKNGVWAEPDRIKFFDWKVTTDNKHVGIGCTKFDKGTLRYMADKSSELDQDLTLGEVRAEIYKILDQ